MSCWVSQIDSFWKTFVLSNDCESSIRAIVSSPPRFGVTALPAPAEKPTARTVRERKAASIGVRLRVCMAAPYARERRAARALGQLARLCHTSVSLSNVAELEPQARP